MLLPYKHFRETVKSDFHLILKKIIEIEEVKAPGGGIVRVPSSLEKDKGSSISVVTHDFSPLRKQQCIITESL